LQQEREEERGKGVGIRRPRVKEHFVLCRRGRIAVSPVQREHTEVKGNEGTIGIEWEGVGGGGGWLKGNYSA